VVWRVGVDLDKPFYTDVIELADQETFPMLVNKHYKLPDDFVPKKLVSLEGSKEISLAAQEAYKTMRNDAAEEDLELGAASGYRSIKDQKKLYDKYVNEEDGDAAKVDTYCARAGQSEHNSGLAIDLIGPNGDMEAFGETAESTWVNANAYKYGFIVRYTEENSSITGYKPEPWHITYVGPDVAQAMYDQNISSLEEYFVKFIWYNPSN
jgi:D-alanyl-D-alanine carboxypeptidase